MSLLLVKRIDFTVISTHKEKEINKDNDEAEKLLVPVIIDLDLLLSLAR